MFGKKEITSTTDPTEKSKPKMTFKSFMKDALSFVLTFAITLVAYRLVFTHFLQKSVVEGSSMDPTLHEKDTLISSRFFELEQGDIVIIRSEKLNKDIVKRVIALEGQTVDIDFEEGTVSVDGAELNEQLYNEGEKLNADYFINTKTTNNMGAFDEYPVVVPEGYVFVLGDNRNVSLDSKSSMLGFVPVDEIIGEVVMRTHPLNNMRLF